MEKYRFKISGQNNQIDFHQTQVALKVAFDQAQKFFGQHLPQLPQIKVYLFYDRAGFNKRRGHEAAKWVAAYNKEGTYRIDIFAPSVFEKATSHSQKEFPQILCHELTHIITKKISGSAQIPMWLGEGLACVVAKQVSQRKDYTPKSTNIFKRLDTLENWQANAKKGGYQQAAYLTKYLLEAFSLKKLISLLRSLDQTYNWEGFAKKFQDIFAVSIGTRKNLISGSRESRRL